MSHRVTASTFTRNAIHFTSLHNSRLLNAQRQIASGLQFELPSEKPIAFRQVRSLETRAVELRADKTVINTATSHLNGSVAALQDMTDLITHARGLVQQGIQALDPDERESLATEIDALLGQAKRISLTQFDGNYLFGGTRSNVPPFSFDDPVRENGTLVANYDGSQQRSQTHIGDTISVDTFYVGAKVFGASGRSETIVVGPSGARHGGATDTLVGRATLQVRHTATSFAPGSGVQTGTGSVGGDTIIGPMGSHQLTLQDTSGTGASGFVSLNGGEPVAFTNGDTNLRVVGLTGEEIFIDTTAITAGFNGTVDIQADGTLSVDDGTSTIPISFGGNQTVSDADSGRFVSIDSSGIRTIGDDALEFSGTSNLFQILHETAADLRNERELSSTEYSAALNRRLGDLDAAASLVFDTMGQQATSLRTVQSMEYRVDDLMLSVESSISEIQATDFPDAVLRLGESQNLLQYTYAVTAQISNLGLLNFLS